MMIAQKFTVEPLRLANQVIEHRRAAPTPPLQGVLTEDLMTRIRDVNVMIRWLRERGFKALSIHLKGRLPMIQVDGAAKEALVAEGSGCNWSNVSEDMRVFTVIVNGCAITWYERRTDQPTKN